MLDEPQEILVFFSESGAQKRRRKLIQHISCFLELFDTHRHFPEPGAAFAIYVSDEGMVLYHFDFSLHPLRLKTSVVY